MKHWLVTGGVGFIGYHLSRALLAEACRRGAEGTPGARGEGVTILDDFSEAPYPLEEKRRNAQDLVTEFPAVRIVRGCITDGGLLGNVMTGMDGVAHLAGLAGVRPSYGDPARYARVNVEGTTRVFEAARQAGVATFIFASSSSVYGNSTPLPAHEEAPAVIPESPYAATKRGAELVVSTLSRLAPEMRCAALRFFTVYGPRQRPEMAITLFARSVLAERPITVFGDGAMRRDFTHVDDIVRGILAVAERAVPGYREYNLGSGAPVDLATLVHAIGEAAGKVPSITYSPVPRGDVDATFADISRARSELGWQPTVTLPEGLSSVMDWVRAHP